MAYVTGDEFYKNQQFDKDPVGDIGVGKMSFIDRVRTDSNLKRTFENGINTGVSAVSTFLPIITRGYRAKKFGTHEKSFTRNDIPKIVNFGTNALMTIDDIILKGKIQEKVPFISDLRTVTAIYTSVPTLKKMMNTYVNVRGNGNIDNGVDLYDYINFVPLLTGICASVVTDSNSSVKKTLITLGGLLAGNHLMQMVNKTGNVKAIKAMNLVKTVSVVGSQVSGNNLVKSMVMSSQNPGIQNGFNKVGGILNTISSFMYGGNISGMNTNMNGGSIVNQRNYYGGGRIY